MDSSDPDSAPVSAEDPAESTEKATEVATDTVPVTERNGERVVRVDSLTPSLRLLLHRRSLDYLK